MNPDNPTEKWRILGLSTLTNALVAAAPAMCMPVLFEEISAELNLDLVQVGIVWGISALPGIFTGLVGGAYGDRIGPKRILLFGCLLSGLFGVLRALAVDFLTLAAGMFLMGLVTPLIPMITLKACGTWFPRRQLGLASGVLSMGMALGFLIGSMFSATVFSPWLGGWRRVLLMYAGSAIALCIPWYLSRTAPAVAREPNGGAILDSLFRTIGYVIRKRNIWLFGLTLLGIGGCIQGALGYLPLYLRGMGWAPASADGALATFHTLSMISVIPIALGSDRIGTRKKVLLAAGLMVTLGIGFLSVAEGVLVWIAVGTAGVVRDGFMAVFMTSILETEGVGPTYAGTATGLVLLIAGLGNLLAPPYGNSLAAISPGLPFAFWASLAAAGLVALLAVKERKNLV